MILLPSRRRRTAAWAAAAALAASTLSLGLAAPAQAATVSIRVNDVFGNGVNADVDILQEDTGSPGTYQPFDDVFIPGTGSLSLPDGNYKIRVADDNDVLRTEWYDNQLDEASATVVTVAGGDFALNTIVLDPRSYITGVLKMGGVPVAGAYVEGVFEDAFDTTDALGRFALPVDPGSHNVFFGDFDERFEGEYWKDAYSLADATDVVVGGANVDLGDVNVGPGGNISGVVTGPNGAPLRGIIVQVYQDTAPFESGSDTTNSLGEYYVGGLPPGAYKMQFFDLNGEFITEFWANTTDPAAASTINFATDQTYTGVNAALALNPAGGTEPPGTDASGVVRDVAGKPLAGIEVRAYTTTDNVNDAIITDRDWTDSQGRYFLTNLNGDNQFKLFYNDEGFLKAGEIPYISSWWKDKRTYNSADPITVAGTKVTGLDVTLLAGGGIHGNVATDAGVPLPRTQLEIYDLNGNYVEGTSGDFAGDFEAIFLRPGIYRVHVAFATDLADNRYIPEWFDDVFTEDAAQKVVVRAGEFTEGIDFKLGSALRTIERPSIGGKVRVGRTVTADSGLWNLSDSTTYDFQWLRGTTVVGTESTYLVTKADAGKQIRLRVGAQNGDLTGLSTSAPSRAKFTSRVVASTSKGQLDVKVKVKDLKKRKITGTVKVKKGKNTLAKVKVVKGQVSIALAELGLKTGKNKLKVVYVGTKLIAADDKKLKIKVKS